MATQVQEAGMKAIWIPAAPILSHVIQPIQGLSTPTRAELSAERDLAASERRLQLPNFVAMFHREAMWNLLPLRLPSPGNVPGRISQVASTGCDTENTECNLGTVRIWNSANGHEISRMTLIGVKLDRLILALVAGM
jgi:hypothetical protein